MSGDVQPRKKKKARRRQPIVEPQVEDLKLMDNTDKKESLSEESPKEEGGSLGKEEGGSLGKEEGGSLGKEEGGSLCSRIVFFVLLVSFVGTGTLVLCDYQSGNVGSLLGREAVWPNWQGIPHGLHLGGLKEVARRHFQDPVAALRNLVAGAGQLVADLYSGVVGAGGEGVMGLMEVVLDFVTTLASVGSSFVSKLPSTLHMLVEETGLCLAGVYARIGEVAVDGWEVVNQNFPFLHPPKETYTFEDIDQQVEKDEIIDNIKLDKPKTKKEVVHEEGINVLDETKKAAPEDKEQILESIQTVEDTHENPEVKGPIETLQQMDDDSKIIKQGNNGDDKDFGSFITEPDFLEGEVTDIPVNEPLFVEEHKAKLEDGDLGNH